MSIGTIYKFLDKMEMILLKGMPIPLTGRVAVNSERVVEILDKLRASIPGEIQDANNLIKRRDEILSDAQAKAEQIVREANFKAQELVKESEVLKAVQAEAEKIKNQVVNDCEATKAKTQDEVQRLKVTSINEAISIREGADKYADSILSRLDGDLGQMHSIVREGQKQMAKFKAESISNIANLKSLLAATEKYEVTGADFMDQLPQPAAFEKWEL